MKYILTSVKLKGKILVMFTQDGILCKIEVDPEDATEKLMHWFLQRIPLHEAAMNEKIYNGLLKIEPVADDLSFEGFWDAYKNKIGKRKRAMKLWEALSDPDRAKAIAGIRRYDAYLFRKPTIEKAYPETYLSNRYWENEY